jgi:predicted DNA-binding transcriptional regulator AlpA
MAGTQQKRERAGAREASSSDRQNVADTERLAYRRKRAASILGISDSLMRKWEHEGRGPKFVRCGWAVLYPSRSLREWLESHCTDPEGGVR